VRHWSGDVRDCSRRTLRGMSNWSCFTFLAIFLVGGGLFLLARTELSMASLCADDTRRSNHTITATCASVSLPLNQSKRAASV
jgi:hypothetical protein